MRLRLNWRNKVQEQDTTSVTRGDWKWRYLMIAILLDLLLVFSFLELVLAAVLLRFEGVPSALLIGGTLTISAVSTLLVLGHKMSDVVVKRPWRLSA